MAAVSDRIHVRKDRGLAGGWVVTWELCWHWHATWEAAMSTANYWAARL